jgi:predicted HicB family RNase H-like nuclease
MITIRDFMEAVDYKITDGSEYLWQSFGGHAFRLDSWDGKHEDGHSVGMVYDTVTQKVYQMEAHDYARRKSYRWTHPDHWSAFREEVKEKSQGQDLAYDDVAFVDLETEEDMLVKAKAIANDLPYDDRVSLPVDLEDHEWFVLMKMAHDKDMTLNQLVEEILWDLINKTKSQVDIEIKK